MVCRRRRHAGRRATPASKVCDFTFEARGGATPNRVKRLFSQVFADAAAHGEPDDRAGARADLRTHRRADAVSQRGPDFEAELYSHVCPERAAEPAAVVEAHIRTNVQADDTPVSQADRVERAPLNIVCLVSPTLPTPPALP